MTPAGPHPREAERLAALRDLALLDSAAEQAFDDLTRLAAHICRAPIAFLSLVDEHRQWFKSTLGVTQTETPRDVAFCAHAILQSDEVFHVTDAGADPRFFDNPLVVGEPHVRMYAGVPLVWGDGLPLGALCVVDTVPRALAPDQIDALRRLGRQAIAQIELRQSMKRLTQEAAAAEQARAELARSERLYRDLVDHAQGLLCWHDLDGRLLMVNDATCRALGYEREDLIGCQLRELVPEDHHEAFDRYLQIMAQTGTFHGLLTLEARSGRRLAVAYQNFTFESPDGVRVMGHGVDITDRVRIEAFNRRLAKALDVSPDFVAFLDQDGRPTYFNAAARQMRGLALKGELTRLPPSAVLGSSEATSQLQKALAEARAGGAHTFQSAVRHTDGTDTPVSLLVVAGPSTDHLEFFAIVARDISQRLQDEEAIRATEARFRRVVENLPDVLFETDLSGALVYVNPAWTALSRYPGEECLGRQISDFVHADDAATFVQRYTRLVQLERASVRLDTRIRRQDGTSRWVELRAHLSWNAAGLVVGTSGSLRDVTEQRELSDALLKASQEALAASRLKSEFVANMSHEVRTPINGVVGLTTLLIDTGLSAEQLDLAEGIRSSAESLLAIVNDVLDISKIEAGKLAIEPVAFPIRRELQHALEPVNVKARKKGIALSLTCAPELPESVISDPTRIRQVLINLTDNAVKFTHHGVVAVTVRPVTEADKPLLRFEVADQGIGIPPEKLDAVFDKFTQADTSTTRKYGGTGLGLAICRQLVGLLGGHIGVTSTVGEGSTFWFELPLVEAARTGEVRHASAMPGAEAPRGLRVLVAEDNSINQKVARRFLEKLGCVVDIAVDGEDAVAKVRQGGYAAVFMDCQMPRMDGYEATRNIRLLPEFAELPIIAMTAHAMLGDREKCLEAGMSDYLSKPLQPDALAGVVARLSQRADQGNRNQESAA